MNNRGYRWYVLARVSPVLGEHPVKGAEYRFVQWTKVKETARTACDTLDRRGLQGIMVFSGSRRQAVTDVRSLFGVTVRGYDSKGALIKAS